MIFKIIIGAFFSFAELILSNNSIVGPDLLAGGGAVEFVELISSVGFFFPLDLLAFMMGVVVVTTGFLITWAMIEWVYKKIPGVD